LDERRARLGNEKLNRITADPCSRRTIGLAATGIVEGLGASETDDRFGVKLGPAPVIAAFRLTVRFL
jgi:hypothetical protein